MNNFSRSEYSASNELRDEPKIDQDPSTEANLADSSLHNKEQYERNSNGFEAMARPRKTRHGSDSLLSMILREKNKAYAEVGKPRENADTLFKGSEAASLSQRSTAGLPEYENASFSESSPPSGLLGFSGSIPYSGSISQRSNSTASTRSFAFPILTAEWNDSPVRMTKADRQRSKKPRFWGVCFNCCGV